MKFQQENNKFSKPRQSGASAIHRLVHWSKRKLGLFRKRQAIYNFSEIETSPNGSVEIQKLVREAGQAAASEAKALGIPKVFANNSQIIKQYPDGRIEIIAEGLAEKMFFRHFKTGVLHARKK